MSLFLRGQHRKSLRNYGYVLNPKAATLEHKLARVAAAHVLEADKQKDTVLWPYLFQCFPPWMWGLQGIGDCVSWLTAHKVDTLMSVQVALKKLPQEIVFRTCSEAFYGFMRVELFGRPDRGGDGAYGGAAAKALVKFGSLHRQQYVDGKYDFRRYSGTRAKTFGRTGVPDELESIAAKFRAKDSVVVTDCEMAGALVQQGLPVDFCGRTSWGTSRDEKGFAKTFKRGAHAMLITGVRYGSRPGFWVANTGHGNHCKGPVGPYPMPDVYAQCGSWLDWDRCEPIFRAGDSFATTYVEGFPLTELPDWGSYDFMN